MRDNPTKGMINMAKGDSFIDKIRRGEVCIGTSVSLRDPVTTEALATSGLFDILWIEMEHMAISLETVERHVMATKGTNVMTIVRVGWNDPVLIKPVLDIGVPAVIVPLVQTADDVRNAVKACRYPPDGIRGFGPRRSADTLEFGAVGGPDWIKKSNEEMITVVQIEHIEAVNNLDEILAVPGLSGIMIGSNDLSGSMGFVGQPRHPEVLETIDTVIEKTRAAGPFVGIALGPDPELHIEWAKKGVQWLQMGGDTDLMTIGAKAVTSRVREAIASNN